MLSAHRINKERHFSGLFANNNYEYSLKDTVLLFKKPKSYIWSQEDLSLNVIFTFF